MSCFSTAVTFSFELCERHARNIIGFDFLVFFVVFVFVLLVITIIVALVIVKPVIAEYITRFCDSCWVLIIPQGSLGIQPGHNRSIFLQVRILQIDNA